MMSFRNRLGDVLQLLKVLVIIVAIPIGTALWMLGIHAAIVGLK